jgi:hypothetical protein
MARRESLLDFVKEYCSPDEYEALCAMPYIGNGAGRFVLKLNSNIVLKVAMNQEGIIQNRFENFLYSSYPNGWGDIKFAPLYSISPWSEKRPLFICQRLCTPTMINDLPDWHLIIDSSQIGSYTSDGEQVLCAYDYGNVYDLSRYNHPDSRQNYIMRGIKLGPIIPIPSWCSHVRL